MREQPVSRTNYCFGFDMAPTHGALVQVLFDEDCQPVGCHPIDHYSGWNWKDLGHGTAFLMMDARERADWLWERLLDFDVEIPSVYVDFTIQGTAFMPSGKMYAAKWCFVMGGFFLSSHDENFLSVVPVPPADIRKHFGLNARADKELVYVKFREQYPGIYKTVKEVKQPKAIRQDYLDAALLAIVGGA